MAVLQAPWERATRQILRLALHPNGQRRRASADLEGLSGSALNRERQRHFQSAVMMIVQTY